MPTISAHVTDEEAKAVELAAAASVEEKVAPYVAEAVRERLRREGKMPGVESHEVAKLTAKVAVAVRRDPALSDQIESLLSKSTRRKLASALS